MRHITVLHGGMEGARLVRELLRATASGTVPALTPDTRVTVVSDTSGDLWAHGLKVCQDLDAVMHLLGGGAVADADAGDRVQAEVEAYGVEPTWLKLTDREFATALVRTQMLEAGYPLSTVTEALCRRWRPGVDLLPMTDDRVETHVAVADPDSPSGRRAIHVREYRERYATRTDAPAPEAVVTVGLEAATPAPGVLAAIEGADLVLVAPADPVGPGGGTLAVPGVTAALRDTDARVVAIAPTRIDEALLAAAGVDDPRSWAQEWADAWVDRDPGDQDSGDPATVVARALAVAAG